MDPVERLVHPHRHRRTGDRVGQAHFGLAVRAALEFAVGVVDGLVAEDGGLGQVRRSRADRDLLPVEFELLLGRDVERGLVDAFEFAGHEVGVGAQAEGRGARAGVGHGVRGAQAPGAHRPAGAQLERPGVAQARGEAAFERDRGVGDLDGGPFGPGDEAVEGGVGGDLVDRQLVVFAVVGVLAVPDPVGPGGEDVAGPAGGELLIAVGGDDMAPAVGVGAHTTADGDDGRLVVVVGDRPLLAGQRHRGYLHVVRKGRDVL